jgi:hypothetical protein
MHSWPWEGPRKGQRLNACACFDVFYQGRGDAEIQVASVSRDGQDPIAVKQSTPRNHHVPHAKTEATERTAQKHVTCLSPALVCFPLHCVSLLLSTTVVMSTVSPE